MADDASARRVQYNDPAGNKISLFEYNGRPYPNFPGYQGETLKGLHDLETRPDDVFVCGYPKSGTNWVWEVVSILLSGKPENVSRSKMAMMMEYKSLAELEAEPSPRIFNSHVRLPLLPKDIHDKRCRIVYLLRNPKDICVSHYHHTTGLHGVYEYDGDWENFVHLWLEGKIDYGNWFDYVTHWEDQLNKHLHLNVHIIYYENLKLDFIGESKKLANFLGVNRSDDFFSVLARKCHIDNMKLTKQNSFSKEENAAWRTNQAGFFRKGIIGDWKQHFTVKQNEMFDTIIQERLSGSKLSFKYEG